MSILCKLGWHGWEGYVLYPYPPDPKNLRVLAGHYYECRWCPRCDKREKHSPGLHSPPYWKPVLPGDGVTFDEFRAMIRTK